MGTWSGQVGKWAAGIICAGGIAACVGEINISKDSDSWIDTDPVWDSDRPCDDGHCVDCSDGVCVVGVWIPTKTVTDCFWNTGTGDWKSTTPTALRDCEPGTDDDTNQSGDQCAVVFWTEEIEAENSCGCEEEEPAYGDGDKSQGSPASDPSGCCTWDVGVVDSTAAQDEVDTLESAFNAICGFGGSLGGWGCVNVDANGGAIGWEPGTSQEGETCCFDSTCQGPSSAAFRLMEADPASSYVSITTAGASHQTAVRGAMLIEPATSSVSQGEFWAAPITAFGFSFSGWVFNLDNVLSVTLSGTNVHASAVDINAARVQGKGMISLYEHDFTLTLGQNVSGQIDLGAGTWTLHHSESDGSGTTATLHLQGTILP